MLSCTNHTKLDGKYRHNRGIQPSQSVLMHYNQNNTLDCAWKIFHSSNMYRKPCRILQNKFLYNGMPPYPICRTEKQSV